MTQDSERQSEYPISRLFLDRWSPRAFTGETISARELATILEAARWAPSSYNSQPWRFLYARNGTEQWSLFLDLLIEFNQSWAREAAALIYIVSKETMHPPGAAAEIPSHSHSFDAGAAWGYMALQAMLSGWHAHAMVGFDIDRTAAALNVPADYRVEAAVAIGRRGDPTLLPPRLAEREIPSPRRPLSEIALEGGFSKA